MDKESGSGIFPDPDPGDPNRPDPDPQHCFKWIWSQTLTFADIQYKKDIFGQFSCQLPRFYCVVIENIFFSPTYADRAGLIFLKLCFLQTAVILIYIVKLYVCDYPYQYSMVFYGICMYMYCIIKCF